MANQFYLWQKLLSRFRLWKSENNLEFRIEGYIIKELNSHNREEIEASQKLRYNIFCKELGWGIKFPAEGKEYDRYDEYAVSFGIFDPVGKLVATSRIITQENPYGFMFQNEFRELLEPNEIKNIDLKQVAEISRTGVDPIVREVRIRGHKLIEYLYKVMYQWSQIHQKRFWIFCINENFLQSLQKTFPVSFHIIGKRKENQKDEAPQLVMIDLKEAERKAIMQLFKSQFFKLFRFFKF